MALVATPAESALLAGLGPGRSSGGPAGPGTRLDSYRIGPATEATGRAQLGSPGGRTDHDRMP
eukprot:574349-Hanusia_phi.AAC.5